MQTPLLQVAFEEINPRIAQFEGKWALEADVFVAKKFYPDFSHQPTVDANFPTRVTLERPQNSMLGILVTWLCLILLVSRPHKYILQATALSSLAILLAMIPAYYLQAAEMIAGHDLVRVLTHDHYVMIPDRPSEFSLVVVKGIRDTLSICSVLVVPALITVWCLWKERQIGRSQEEQEAT